jgi:hypothetical protein
MDTDMDIDTDMGIDSAWAWTSEDIKPLSSLYRYGSCKNEEKLASRYNYCTYRILHPLAWNYDPDQSCLPSEPHRIVISVMLLFTELL